METPFGSVNTSTDPDDAARNLGVDLYPGAEVIKGTTSNMTMGAMHTATADFETSDPVSTVGEFYKSKLPNANVVSTTGDHYAIISTDKKNMLSINIEAEGRQNQNSHRPSLRQDGRRRRRLGATEHSPEEPCGAGALARRF